jgi:hypothetical protein
MPSALKDVSTVALEVELALRTAQSNSRGIPTALTIPLSMCVRADAYSNGVARGLRPVRSGCGLLLPAVSCRAGAARSRIRQS